MIASARRRPPHRAVAADVDELCIGAQVLGEAGDARSVAGIAGRY